MDYEPNRPRRLLSVDGVQQPPNYKVVRPRQLYQQPQQPSLRPINKTPVNVNTNASTLANKRAPLSDLSIPIPANLDLELPPEQIRKAKRKQRRSKAFKVTASALMVLILVVSGWSYWNVHKVFHGTVFSNVHALFSNTKLKGEDQGRVNVLLAGDSADDPGHAGAKLTDSIMILSIDTKKHTGFMMSVPRDLWVDIPGLSSHQKINAANEVNDFSQDGFPAGGMGQLEQIVQDDFGIPINYYSLINYTAFKDAVDSVGGITVNIQSTDPRGLYDPNINKHEGGPLKLPNGPVNLTGRDALNLARARGDPCFCRTVEYGFPGSDFDRTQHQRQMLVALQQKALTAGVLANPFKVSQLFSAVGNNIQTDIHLQEALRFIQLTKNMNVTKLQSLGLSNSGDHPLLTSYTAPNGQSALIPKAGIDSYGQIRQFYQQLTSDNPLVKESPSVVVLNGNGIAGMAKKESNLLQTKEFNVLSTTDADGLYPNTLIIDNTNGQKPVSKQTLQKAFPAATFATSQATAEAREAQGYTADFIIILGHDVSAPANTSPQN